MSGVCRPLDTNPEPRWIELRLSTFVVLPFLMGMYGAAASEDEEAALLMQACGGDAAQPALADGGSGGGEDDRLSVLDVATVAARGLRTKGVDNPTTQQIATATAIAWAQSKLRPTAHNPKPPDDSYGLWQINMIGRLGPERRAQFGLDSNDELYSPGTVPTGPAGG